ncbi:MAG TPA: phosphocholine cytidylyltransferase family protein [Pyrinomonadaceae bacterium]|jgi:L-glutamine-phosphate cytidylyltransferase|nr:phosphocholine cytidylyltransferase family protein [Pyrinomonadaceae bacterium]
MKAIILAAGKGTRLNGSGVKPKCLFEVGGRTLLDRQLSALVGSQLSEIVVVVGFEAERIRQQCPSNVSFVVNSQFGETSSLYSLWMARDHLLDGFVVLNCDVLFHPQLLTKLISSPFDDALLVDLVDKNANHLGDEEMKVKVANGLVVDIRKDLDPAEADGENVGMVKFSSEGAKRLVHEMDSLISRGFNREWAPRAFREFALRFPLHAISTEDLPWIEIDFPEDYRKAKEEVFPRITELELCTDS